MYLDGVKLRDHHACFEKLDVEVLRSVPICLDGIGLEGQTLIVRLVRWNQGYFVDFESDSLGDSLLLFVRKEGARYGMNLILDQCLPPIEMGVVEMDARPYVTLTFKWKTPRGLIDSKRVINKFYRIKPQGEFLGSFRYRFPLGPGIGTIQGDLVASPKYGRFLHIDVINPLDKKHEKSRYPYIRGFDIWVK